MAEVTGDLGGQPIQLNNAATEATLKEILAAILKAGIAGKGGKAQKDLEKKLADLAKQTEELTAEQKDALKQAKEIQKKKDEEIKQAKELGQAYQGLLSAALGVISGMTNLMSTLSRLDNSMTSAAQSMSAIPIVGGTLATVFGAVTGAAERTYKAFQQAATVGANFGGSINDMIRSASGAGLTFDQFSGIVSRTGSDLALLGGSTAEGAKRLAELGKGIRQSPLNDQLARMGYTTEQINESMAKYSGILAKTGALSGMSNAQLIAQTGQYLQNLDAVSKLTGQTKKDLEEQRAQRMKDAQFRYITSKMDAKSQEELNAFLDTLPPELQEGAKEIIATGTATTESGKAFMTYMSGSSAKLMGINQQIEQTGKFTAANARELNRAVQSEARDVAKGPLAGNIMKFGEKFDQGVMVGIANLSSRQKDIGQIQDETARAEAERQKKAKENLDPAKLKSFQEQIAEISNRFTMLLANSNLLNDFFSVFQTMVGFIETVVVPVFQFLSDNAIAVAAVLAPLVAIVGITKAAFAALQIQIQLERIARKGGIIAIMKQAAASLLAALPFIKFIAIGAALVAVVALLINNFDSIIDSLLEFLNVITFGKFGITKEEAARRKAEREAKKQQDERNKTDKEGLNLQRQGVDLQRQENEARQQSTNATKESGGVFDLSTPQKMFESAMRRQQGEAQSAARQPGAAQVAPGLGGMAARFESGAAGSSAVGWDSTGGTSYGKYQIATKTGTMNKFMEHLKATNPEAYARLSKAGPADSGKDGAFAQEWKKLAGEGKLAASEHEFIKKTHYDVGAAGLKDKNLQDMLGKSKALQEVMWSTSVQHGGGGASGIFNKVYKEGMSEQDLIKAIYAERGTKFGSSTAQVRASVQNRFAQEQQLALGLVGQPGTETTQVAATRPGTATPTATSVQTAVAQAPAPTAAKPSTTPQATTQAASQTQESPATLLSSLNSKMDVLIALNRRANDTRDRQLSAARATAGEVTPYAAA